MEMHSEVVAANTLMVLLAAGSGSRFTGTTHKLLANLDGRSVAATAIDHALDAHVGPLLIVTGAVDLSEIIAAASTTRQPNTVAVIQHAGWAAGQATSLGVAVAEAERREFDAIVVGLADQPFIDPGAWRQVAAATAPIAVATYAGHRRNPVRLHRSVWPLLPIDGDEGARAIIRLRPELVQEIPCAGSAADIDTLEDLASWQNKSSTNSP